MNVYKQLKNKQQSDINEFPMFFAFNNDQLYEGLTKLGLKKDDTDKIIKTVGGAYIKKTDLKDFHKMLDNHTQEFWDKINEDTTGEKFVFHMFAYELANHEYGWTRDIEDTLDCLGITYDEVNSKANLKAGLEKAKEYVIANSIL